MSDEERSDAQVINLASLRPGERAPIVEAPRKYTGCQHPQVEVDARLRTVQCADCDVTLDPVQVLLDMADRYRRTEYLVREQREIAEKAQAKREKRAAQDARRAALPRCGAQAPDGRVCNLERGHKMRQHWQWVGQSGSGWFGPTEVRS